MQPTKIFNICTDIIKTILSLVSDDDKFNFLSSCKFFLDKIQMFTFDENKYYNYLKQNSTNLKYYDQFTNITIYCDDDKYEISTHTNLSIPTNIKKLKIINTIHLSKNNLFYVQKLTLVKNFNFDVGYKLPLSIKKLSLDYVDQKNIDVIPSSIISLKARKLLCQLPSENFPNLTKLRIKFFKKSCKYIPKTVTDLRVFLFKFVDVEHLLTLKLIKLNLEFDSHNFDKIIEVIGCTKVQKLNIKINLSDSDYLRLNLNNLIANTVTNLTLYLDPLIEFDGKISNSVTKLKIININNRRSLFDILPDNIQSLKLEYYVGDLSLSNKKFPSTLTYLNMGYCFNYPINNLFSDGLKYLKLGENYRKNINGKIPLTVTHLKISGQPALKNQIPSTITHLKLYGNNKHKRYSNKTTNENYYKDLNESIPLSVTHLTLGVFFKQDIADAITPNITHLKLNKNFKGKFDHNILNKVKYLTIPKHYKNILSKTTNIAITYI